MALQEFISKLTANIFFREFSFSQNQFSPTTGVSLELADQIVWIDNLLLVFQLKEREAVQNTSEETERKWFENKVLAKATRQIRDTLQYLKEQDKIVIVNERGHQFDLEGKSISTVGKVVLYSATEKLPPECRQTKYYLSSTAGLIHLFPVEEYLNACRTLVTPADILEYLSVRERILLGSSGKDFTVSEKALVGQFVSGNDDATPDNSFAKYVDDLDNSTDSFDLNALFYSYGDRIAYTTSGTNERDYYRILAEFAKLKRSVLREARKRIDLCIKACKSGEFKMPYRFFNPETQCGFLFIPMQHEFVANRLIGLQNLTHAAKYAHKATKQIGVSFVKDGDIFLIDWCYIEAPWQHNASMEAHLKDNDPFREVREQPLERFKFRR